MIKYNHGNLFVARLSLAIDLKNIAKDEKDRLKDLNNQTANN